MITVINLSDTHRRCKELLEQNGFSVSQSLVLCFSNSYNFERQQITITTEQQGTKNRQYLIFMGKCLCLKPIFIRMESEFAEMPEIATLAVAVHLTRLSSVPQMGHNTNSPNPDETPHNVRSGQGLHFLLECHI